MIKDENKKNKINLSKVSFKLMLLIVNKMKN